MNLHDMFVLMSARVGVQANADGADGALRMGKQGDLLTSNLHPRYAEATIRRNTFFNDAPGVAMSAPATAAIGNIVWNPPDSGVVLALTKWFVANTVTDANAMAFQLGYSVQATVPTTTSASVCGPCYLSALGSGGGKAKGYGIATITTAATPMCMLGHIEAAVVGTGEDLIQGDFEGHIVVPPGFLVHLMCVVAAGTAGVYSTLMWEEIPI